jgi:hypothetical protein
MTYKLIYLARRNPNVAWEDWPSTWRSHAEFVGQLGWIAGYLEYLFYCCRMGEAPAGEVGVASEHDGVAIVASRELRNLSDSSGTPPEIRARIDDDERRVFDMLTPEFSFYCSETEIRAGPHGTAAVVDFLVRKPGLSRSDFVTRWGGQHAELERSCGEVFGAVTRCVHNELILEPPPRFPFDGIVETWFASADDAERSLVDRRLDPIRQDRHEFCDPERSVTMLTSVCHSWKAS